MVRLLFKLVTTFFNYLNKGNGFEFTSPKKRNSNHPAEANGLQHD